MAELPSWAESLLRGAVANASCGMCCNDIAEGEVVVEKVKAFPSAPGIPSEHAVFKPENTDDEDTNVTEELAHHVAPVLKQEFMVRVSKTPVDSKIGLDTVARSSPSEGCALRVEKVKAGLVLQWNSLHPDMQVQPGDHICEVNGERSDTEKMYTIIAASTDLALFIKRRWPAPPRNPASPQRLWRPPV